MRETSRHSGFLLLTWCSTRSLDGTSYTSHGNVDGRLRIHPGTSSFCSFLLLRLSVRAGTNLSCSTQLSYTYMYSPICSFWPNALWSTVFSGWVKSSSSSPSVALPRFWPYVYKGTGSTWRRSPYIESCSPCAYIQGNSFLLHDVWSPSIVKDNAMHRTSTTLYGRMTAGDGAVAGT